MKSFGQILISLMLVSVGVGAEQTAAKEDDDIREIVIRALFRDAGIRGGVKVFFLSAEEWRTDPTDGFMARFASNKPPVRKVSLSAEKEGKVFDKQTGERGVIFSVMNLRRKSDTEVQIDGSVYRAGLNGYTDTYTLTKKSGKWKITDKKIKSIS